MLTRKSSVFISWESPWTAVTLILRREPVQLSVTTLTAEDGALKEAWNIQRPPSPIFGLG
jgi:hypothetical protein